MFQKKCLILLPMVALIMCSAVAQQVTTGRETNKATVNFSAVAKYYKEHPLPATRKAIFDEDEHDRPVRAAVDPSLVHMMHRSESEIAAHRAHNPEFAVTPALNDTFESTPSDLTGIPPDTHGAVDSEYAVTAINTAIHVQSRSGYSFSDVSLDGFWEPMLTHGPGSYDPRVHFDEIRKRWIMVADAYGESTTSMFFVAVSKTENPLGDWNMISITVDPSGASWMDFPNVGYNQKWIAVTGNMFPNGAGGAYGAVVYVINYDSIVAGAGAYYTKYSEPSSFAICPTLTYDSTEPNLFMMENWDNTTGKLRLWKVTGTAMSPTLSTVGYPMTSTHWQSSSTGGADFLPQVGSTNKMDAGDDRITSCTYRNHHLWCTHTIFLPASGTVTHSSIMWWEVDTAASPMQNGLINDPTAAVDYAYSSIAVNANDDALIGSGYFSHSVHASACYAMRLGTDALDSLRPRYVYRHGLAYYYETFGGGRDRWGDFSATCIDPRNDTDFWTIQESTIVGTSPNWDTWWANVQPYCAKPQQPTMAFTAPIPCAGATATYAVNPVGGATTYVWTVSGTGWSGSSTTDSFTVTAGTGVATVTVLAYNACGEGENHIFTVTPHVAPARPYVSVFSAPCPGSTTAIYSATASGATGFTWVAIDSGWSGSSTATSLTATVGTGTGMIICTAINACGNSIPDTLYQTPIPVAATPTIHPTSGLCLGSTSATFTATAAGSVTYHWAALDSGWSGGGSGTTFTATVGTGIGMIICGTANACGSGIPDTIYVSTVPAPTASFVQNRHVMTIAQKDTVTYTGSTIGVDSFNWNFGGGTAIPGIGAGPQYVQWSSTGLKTITLKVTDTVGCASTVYSDTLLVTDTIPFGIKTITGDPMLISIYPNPSDGTFDIVFGQPVTGAVDFDLADMQGRIVYHRVFDQLSGNRIAVSAANLANGIYFATIRANSNVTNVKVSLVR